MENIQEKIKTILHESIQNGLISVADCFEEICKATNFSHEFNALTALEKIMTNNIKIADYHEQRMYDKLSTLYSENASLYDVVNRETAQMNTAKEDTPKLSTEMPKGPEVFTAQKNTVTFGTNSQQGISTAETKNSSTFGTNSAQSISTPQPLSFK